MARSSKQVVLPTANSLIEPLEFPAEAVEKLCDALNAANAAVRAHFKSCGIEYDGDFFAIKFHDQRKQLAEAALEYKHRFLHNIPALLAAEPQGRA